MDSILYDSPLFKSNCTTLKAETRIRAAHLKPATILVSCRLQNQMHSHTDIQVQADLEISRAMIERELMQINN